MQDRDRKRCAEHNLPDAANAAIRDPATGVWRLDTGIHWYGWSRDEAEGGLPLGLLEQKIDRWIAEGQADG